LINKHVYISGLIISFYLLFCEAQDFIISNLREQAIFLYAVNLDFFYFHRLLGLLRATETGFLLKLLIIILLYFQVRFFVQLQ